MNYEEGSSHAKAVAFIIGLVIVALLGVIAFFGSFGTVDAGERGVKTRNGAITGEVIEPGLYFKWPFIDEVHPIEVRTKTMTFDDNTLNTAEEDDKGKYDNSLGAASKDSQQVEVSVVVNYSINPAEARSIYEKYRDVESYQNNVLEPIVRDNTKAITAQYTAEELLAKRGELNERVTSRVRELLAERSALAENINIVNIDFSEAFNNAIEQKVTAQQNAEKAKNQLAQAKYDADKVIEEARGNAESIRIRTEALAQSQSLVEFTKAEALKISAEKGQKIVPDTVVGNSEGLLFNLNR